MLETTRKPSRYISKVDLRERIYAFFVTSAAVFVLACLIWPLSVTGFRSTVKINVRAGGEFASPEKLEELLGNAVKIETQQPVLDSIVAEIIATGKLSSQQTELLDHVAITNRIKFGVQKNEKQFSLSVVYDGEGHEEERALVDHLAVRVANRLAADSVLENGGASSLESFARAEWIIEQIENDLDVVRSGLSSMTGSSNQVTSSGDASTQRSSPFHQASRARVLPAGIDGLERTIASIDIQSLRETLIDLKRQVTHPEEALATQRQTGARSGLSVTSLSPGKTAPIRGVPGFGALLALGAFAGLVGTVIAGHYEPFATRGFAGVDAVRKTLGVPIVATINASESSADGSPVDSNQIGWANRLVKLAGLLLFGIFVVIAGFILISPDVRSAFFENPFYGCAKIVRIFVGY